MARRTERDVIDDAIREGRTGTRIAYASIIVGVVGAVAAIVQAIVTEQWLWTVGSGVTAVWLWPCFRFAQRIRNQSLAIRLLEIPLSKAESSEEAAKVLVSFFENTLAGPQEGVAR